MMVPSHLVWLAHVLPAVALTITAPATTPSTVATSCGTDNLIQEGNLAGVDVTAEDGVWNILPQSGISVVDDQLFVLNLTYHYILVN
jgi:hypothetical protein